MVYIYKQLQPNQGTTLALAGAEGTLTFKSDASAVYNMSKGFLSFDVTLTTNGNTVYNYLYADRVPLNQVVVRSSSGTEYARISNLGQYLKHVQPVNTSADDYVRSSPCIPASGANAVTLAASRYMSGNQASHAPGASAFTGLTTDATGAQTVTSFTITASGVDVAVTPANIDNYVNNVVGLNGARTSTNRFVYTGATGGTAGFLVSTTPASNTRTSIWSEVAHQRLIRSPIDAGGGEDVLRFSYHIPLSDIKHSILSMDEDMFFDDVLTLEFQSALLAEMGYQGAADFIPDDELAGYSMSNINLWLPQQQDMSVIDDVKNEFYSSNGYKEIPRVICQADAFAAGVNINRSYELSSADGSKFICAYYTITKDADYATNISYSANANHWLTSRSSINSKFLQDSELDLDGGECYQWLHRFIKNSAIMGQQEYQVAPVWVDNFSEVESSTELNDARDGLDLGASQLRYGVIATKEATAPGLMLCWLVVNTPFSLKNRTQLPASESAPLVA